MNDFYLDTARMLVQAAPHIFFDDTFALKGGTAINLFFRENAPSVRRSRLGAAQTTRCPGSKRASASTAASSRKPRPTAGGRRVRKFAPGGKDGEDAIFISMWLPNTRDISCCLANVASLKALRR